MGGSLRVNPREIGKIGIKELRLKKKHILRKCDWYGNFKVGV